MSQIHSTKPEDSRDLEQVIYDVVEYQNDENFERLYELLVDRQLFLPITPESTKSIPINFKLEDEFINNYLSQIKFYEKEMSGEYYIAAFTTNLSPQLVGKNYVRIDWIDFLSMVLKIEHISGFSLQGQQSWLALGKDEIHCILSNYKSSTNKYEYIVFKAGGIYSCKSGEQGFSIVKVLVAEEMGVHLCFYSNEFSDRPQMIHPIELQVSIGHAPILRTGFINWEPELMLEEMVTEQELSGYYYYLNAMTQQT
jgi:hypothetical protein